MQNPYWPCDDRPGTVPSTGRTRPNAQRDPCAWKRLLQCMGRHWTPWLCIRYNLTDMGLRPIPANVPFWVSPDIWVESPDAFGNPVAGQENFVHARIFNHG